MGAADWIARCGATALGLYPGLNGPKTSFIGPGMVSEFQIRNLSRRVQITVHVGSLLCHHLSVWRTLKYVFLEKP